MINLRVETIFLICISIFFLRCEEDPTSVISINTNTITLNENELAIHEGETYQLIATAINNNGDTLSGIFFSWTSSVPSVASVNENGLINAFSDGVSYISAKYHNTVSEPCTVIVKLEYELIWTKSSESTIIQFSSDGNLLLSSSHYLDLNHSVGVWNSSTGENIWSVGGISATLSPDGSLVALGVAGRGGAKLEIRSSTTGNLFWEGQQLQNLSYWWNTYLQSAAFSPDGNLVAFAANGVHIFTSDRDGEIAVWESNTGNLLWSAKHTEGNERGGALSFSPDGNLLVSGGHRTRAWNSISGKLVWESENTYEVVTFSPDGKLIATSNSLVLSGNGFNVLSSSNGDILWSSRSDESSIAFSPNSNQIATFSPFRNILRNASTGELIWSSGKPDVWFPTSVDFHPSGTEIVWSDREWLYIKRVNDGELIWKAQNGETTTVKYSPNGNKIATGGFRSDSIKVWTLAGQ